MRLAVFFALVPLVVSCASTSPSLPATQPLDRDEKSHDQTGGPVETKAPTATESSLATTESSEEPHAAGSADVSYEDALKNAESKATDEGMPMTECNVISGNMAMGCGLSGSATAKFLVQNGVVKGVTVTTEPDQPAVVTCMRDAIAGHAFTVAQGPTGCVRKFKLSE